MLSKLFAWIRSAFGRKNPPQPKPVDPPTTEEDPNDSSLPRNPPIAPDPATGRGERWDFAHKEYDRTYRIRWPSTLAGPPHNIGPGSWCMAGSARAEWRSFDTDHGARRPSYTMPLATPVAFPVRCVLHAADGRAVAWFEAPGPNTNGRLP